MNVFNIPLQKFVHTVDGKLENTIEFAIGLASFHCKHLMHHSKTFLSRGYITRDNEFYLASMGFLTLCDIELVFKLSSITFFWLKHDQFVKILPLFEVKLERRIRKPD